MKSKQSMCKKIGLEYRGKIGSEFVAVNKESGEVLVLGDNVYSAYDTILSMYQAIRKKLC